MQRNKYRLYMNHMILGETFHLNLIVAQKYEVKCESAQNATEPSVHKVWSLPPCQHLLRCKVSKTEIPRSSLHPVHQTSEGDLESGGTSSTPHPMIFFI